MTHTPEGDSVLRRLGHRVLDGDTPWGSMSVRPQRWGATSYRIVIYPPGITREECRRVRVWRGFPEWGVLLWLSAGATSFAQAKTLRKQVRSAEVTLPYPNSDVAMLVRTRLIESIGTP